MSNPQKLLQKYISLPPGECEAYIEPLSEEIRKLVRRSLVKHETADLEDFELDCLLAIWTRIDAIKRGIVDSNIENIEAFVRRAVHNRYCDAIRRKRPSWYNLKLEMMDLFSGKLNVKGLSMWVSDSGERVCGYAKWEGRAGNGGAKCREISEDMQVFARRMLENRDPAEISNVELACKILDYVGAPVPIDDLVSCIAALKDVRDSEPLSIDSQPDGDEEADSPVQWLVDDHVDVEQQVINDRWLDHVIKWFWNEFMLLAPRQRKAMMLGMGADQVTAIISSIGLEETAKALEMPEDKLLKLIPQLPLPDAVTGEEIGVPARSVPSVRFKAWRRIQRRSRKSGISLE
jgi:DNA-directed RNA polymerase specialized sigma24 family protein